MEAYPAEDAIIGHAMGDIAPREKAVFEKTSTET
jgi:hypothetical protein